MSREFVPAAGHDLLLPLYDPLWLLMGGSRVRAVFIRDAGIASGQRILDVGCGTGNLAIQIAQTCSGVEIHALDPDPKALARAARKDAKRDVQWKQGFADALPYEDGSIDRVVSSFMFHHLDLETKHAMLREAFRVLSPGGELHLVDFGGQNPAPGATHSDGLFARLLHSHEQLEESRVPCLFEDAGFADVAELSQQRSLFGRYAHTRGSKVGEPVV